jgi:hypothetical protein
MTRRRFVPAAGVSFVSVRKRGRLMLSGIVKAILIVSVVVIADQYFANGVYTDGALSMLRQMRQSFN